MNYRKIDPTGDTHLDRSNVCIVIVREGPSLRHENSGIIHATTKVRYTTTHRRKYLKFYIFPEGGFLQNKIFFTKSKFIGNIFSNHRFPSTFSTLIYSRYCDRSGDRNFRPPKAPRRGVLRFGMKNIKSHNFR